MITVYVVSHAQSVHHVERLVGGWYDTGVTEFGRLQAEMTGRFLASEIQGDALIYSSDLRRASETAMVISGYLDSDVQLDFRLREMCYGVAEGKPRSWGDEHILPKPPDGDRMNHTVFDGAESRLEVARRVRSALDEILAMGAENTVIVTHGFASTFLIMAWMKIPEEHLGYCNLPSKPGCVTKLAEDEPFGNRGLEYLCNTSHLK